MCIKIQQKTQEFAKNFYDSAYHQHSTAILVSGLINYPSIFS